MTPPLPRDVEAPSVAEGGTAAAATFHGVMPVLQTPFGTGPGQPVLHDALGRLVERLIVLGVDGLVALGLASEASRLSEQERDSVCSTAAAAIRDRVPLVVGIDGETAVALQRARRAAEHGAAMLMVLPPPEADSEQVVIDHFRCIAAATELPLLVQDSPQVTGFELTAALLAALADAEPFVRGAKLEGPDAMSKTPSVVAAGLEVVAGWGGIDYLERLRCGAIGCMPGSDLGPAFHEIHRLAATSPQRAQELYLRVLPLLSYASQSLEMLILASKRALMRHGVFPTATLRHPGRRLTVEEARTLDAFFARLDGEQVPGW